MRYGGFAMDNFFDRHEIKKAWNTFINNKPLDQCSIRKEILDSWIRSKNYGVNWEFVPKKVLDKNALLKRIEQRKPMVEISITMMETIYSTVKNSGFLVVLTDEEGYVLKIIGDLDAYSRAKTQENILVEGANRNEKYIGTNGIGICITKDIPIQVWADEHYYSPHRHWTCSAAPIHDLNGNLIGCLNLSGPSEKIHLHSLGMLVSSVKAIEMQMQIKNAYNKIYLYNSQLNAILDSIPYGTILLDNFGTITQVNELAMSILNLNSKRNIGRNIDEILEYNKSIIDLNSIKSNIYDKELVIDTKDRSIRCSVSISITYNKEGKKIGLVLTLKENKFVHQLINKLTAAQAEFSFEDIIGNSKVMLNAKKYGIIASESNSTVILLGGSGTGKELFAQSIHNNSNRGNKPFIAINCGALPRNLIESELFGYEGGSFTGAKKEGRPGKFELASGGTIFLDEIGDMPLDLQVSLLRVLENREVTRIGGTNNIKIDVRVISATNKNLEELVYNRMFREDLFYRLNVLSINIPPLRDRNEDIIALSDFFLEKYNKKLGRNITGFERDVYTIFSSYDWPGNVRELENVIERAVNISENNIITTYDLTPKLKQKNYIKPTDEPLSHFNPSKNLHNALSLKEMEVRVIIDALKKYNGNIKRVSEELGIGRRTAYRKFKEYNIDYNKYRIS